MSGRETIVALSSGALPSGVAIVRLSGSRVRGLLQLLAGVVPEKRRLVRRAISLDGTLLDDALVAFFSGPHSYTGEDVGEVHLHGSRAVVAALLSYLGKQAGVRLAEPGEFTRRAFEAGKLDLTAVEGLSDLIAAETENQRVLALARAQGGLANRVERWREVLVTARAKIEAVLDFSDEDDVQGDLENAVYEQLERLADELKIVAGDARRGRLIREGIRVGLAGPPNTGKSRLFNALACADVAIVTAEAGTTRDVHEMAMDLAGNKIVLVDMAGLREASSLAEKEGVLRARREIGASDLVLWLVAPDVDDEALHEEEGTLVWRVGTKSDLGPVAGVDMSVCAISGDGLDELVSRLTGLAQKLVKTEPVLVSRERDREALMAAAKDIKDGLRVAKTPELCAEQLRSAGQRLARLVGAVGSEDVLAEVFSRFCIGK